MKKKLAILLMTALSLVMFSANIQAQNEAEKEYFDLLMLYLDGDYDKLFKKADKYMESDKTRKDPLPYLYASMGYFELRNDEELAAEYPNALKDALKLAIKFERYDRANKYTEEGDEYMIKLRSEIKQEAIFELEEGKDSRCEYYLKQLLRIDEFDYSVIYFQLYLAAKDGDGYTMNELRGQFQESLKMVQDWSKEPSDKRSFLMEAMIRHAKFQKEKGRTDAAIKTLKELESFLGKTPDSQKYLKEWGA